MAIPENQIPTLWWRLGVLEKDTLHETTAQSRKRTRLAEGLGYTAMLSAIENSEREGAPENH